MGGGDLKILRTATNIFSKQTRRAFDLWSFSIWVGNGATMTMTLKEACLTAVKIIKKIIVLYAAYINV
jgi:hypothetical protein